MNGGLRVALAGAVAVAGAVGLSPVAAAATTCHAWSSSYVKTENARAGGTGWRYVAPVTATSAQFWLDRSSAACGQSVGVHLAAMGTTHFQLWRLGWYAGARGRLISSWNAQPSVHIPPDAASLPSPSSNVAGLPPMTTHPGELAAAAGAPPPIDSFPAYASASAAAWPTATMLTIKASMPPGLYVLLGRGPDGVQTGAPLIVRDDLGPHALTVVASTLTWAAYNPWGVANLYEFPGADGSVGSGWADVVTMDRPIQNLWSHAQVIGEDRAFAQLLDKDNLDVNWIASQDLQQPHAMLYRTRALVETRHDEYWSVQMRLNTDRLVHAGVNLIDLGGNNMYQAGKFLDTSLRWYQVRKNGNALHADDGAFHVSYRFVDPPQSNPQARLIGENFNCLAHWVPYVVSDPHFWAWASQGLPRGSSFPEIVGSESDGPDAGYPARTVFPSLSPLVCGRSGVHKRGATSYRVDRRSLAGIIDIGSLNWLCNLTTAGCPSYTLSSAAGRRFVTRTTTTILREASVGPLGRRHPATGGVSPGVSPSYSALVE